VKAAITLVALSTDQLCTLANGAVPADFASRVEPGALPPAFVAARTLAQREAAALPAWFGSYLMMRSTDQRIVGGCGFKFPPSGGQVEIGYAVAPSARRQGIASAAVAQLLDLAFDGAEIDTVLAHVNPDNVASSGVLAGLGFAPGLAELDTDREMIIPWRRSRH
jgi:RimJ/RimL family protein N-acetyltransferase